MEICNKVIGESGIERVKVDGYEMSCFRDGELAYKLTLPVNNILNITIHEDEVCVNSRKTGAVVLLYKQEAEVFEMVKRDNLIGLALFHDTIVSIIDPKVGYVLVIASKAGSGEILEKVKIDSHNCKRVEVMSTGTLYLEGRVNSYAVSPVFSGSIFMGLSKPVKVK